jgi:hypothetical protein
MVTFSDTANIDYLLLFAGQGKLTSVLRLPFAENRQKFAVSVFHCSKQMEVAMFHI